jgi:hypothetical protein
LPQGKPCRVGHRKRTFETDGRGHGQVAADEVGPRGHQHLAPGGCGVRGEKCGAVIGHTVTHRAEVQHVDPIHQLAMENGGHILDAEVFDPHLPRVGAGQIDTEMAVDRRVTPDHVDPAPRPGADDGRDRDDVAIGGEGSNGPGLRKASDLSVRGVAGPARHARLGQVAGQNLQARRDPQIGSGQDRRLPHVAQARDAVGLHDLQAIAEIGIGSDQCRIGGRGPGVGARRAVAARPDLKSVGECGRHQGQSVRDHLVHGLPLCSQAGKGRPRRTRQAASVSFASTSQPGAIRRSGNSSRSGELIRG